MLIRRDFLGTKWEIMKKGITNGSFGVILRHERVAVEKEGRDG